MTSLEVQLHLAFRAPGFLVDTSHLVAAESQTLSRSSMHLHEKVYAALFAVSLRAWSGDAQTASLLTASALGGALATNMLVCAIWASVASGVSMTPEAGIALSMVLVAAPGTVVYKAFLRESRYEHLARAFVSLSGRGRRRYTIMGWAYLALSYGGAILVGLLMASRHD